MFTTPNHHPLPIHDPCTTIVTIITISALLSRSLFISFLWKHTNHVFDSRSNLVSSCFKSLFFLRCIEAPLTKILCRSFWPRSPGVAHRHFDAHATAAQTSQNPSQNDKTSLIEKMQENTRRHDECLNSGDAVFHLDMIFWYFWCMFIFNGPFRTIHNHNVSFLLFLQT